jgi:hypothetical protein
LTSDPFGDVDGNFTFADTTFVMGGPLSMNKVSDGPLWFLESLCDANNENRLDGLAGLGSWIRWKVSLRCTRR